MRDSGCLTPPPPTGQPEPEGGLWCSFCQKTNREVRHLIAGKDAMICEECVVLCVGILTGTAEPKEPANDG
jgi:hypothetical protein